MYVCYTEDDSIQRGDQDDGDLLAWLEKQPNKQGYIKALIRKDILEHETGENGSQNGSQTKAENTQND